MTSCDLDTCSDEYRYPNTRSSWEGTRKRKRHAISEGAWHCWFMSRYIGVSKRFNDSREVHHTIIALSANAAPQPTEERWECSANPIRYRTVRICRSYGIREVKSLPNMVNVSLLRDLFLEQGFKRNNHKIAIYNYRSWRKPMEKCRWSRRFKLSILSEFLTYSIKIFSTWNNAKNRFRNFLELY